MLTKLVKQQNSNHFINTVYILDGIVTYNDFDIDENISFKDQEFFYKEDMLQISFDTQYVLDVGWYPEFQPTGSFLVQGIQNCDWTNPIIVIKCKTLKELKTAIEQIALILSEKSKLLSTTDS